MGKSGKKPVERAEEIIEKFGGLRPMASKIDVRRDDRSGLEKARHDSGGTQKR